MQTTFTDLTGCQWEVPEKMLKSHRPRQHSLRTIINAILWLSRTGSQWRNLKSRYPPWQSISSSFRLWQENGLWDRLLSSLVQQERIRQGREADTTQKPPSEKGFVPQEGRWPIERSFGWLQFFRRLAREEMYLRENLSICKGIPTDCVHKCHAEQIGLDFLSNML